MILVATNDYVYWVLAHGAMRTERALLADHPSINNRTTDLKALQPNPESSMMGKDKSDTP